MTKPSILIVDDNEVDARLLEGMLREEGDYQFYRVGSGSGAMEHLSTVPNLDLILLDVYLPDTSGVDICRDIKNNPVTAAISVILISGVHKDSASIAAGLQAGADGYLTKPLHINEVRAWSRAALRIRGFMRAQAEHVCPASNDTELMGHFSKLSHSVNNPLQALMANADLLALNMAGQPQDLALVAEIQRYADRIANLVAEASAKAALRMDTHT